MVIGNSEKVEMLPAANIFEEITDQPEPRARAEGGEKTSRKPLGCGIFRWSSVQSELTRG